MKFRPIFLTKTGAMGRIALAAALGFSLSMGLAWSSERVVLDFSGLNPGETLPKAIGGTHLLGLHSPKIDFLTSETTPPNPFPDATHAISVSQDESTDEALLRIRLKPFFETSPPPVGWIELELFLNSTSHNSIEIGTGGISGLDSATSPVYEGVVILGINLRTDGPVDVTTFPVDSRRVVARANPSPTLGVPFRLRIAWDFSTEIPAIQLFIDGQQLHDASGGELRLEIPNKEAHDGVDYLSVILRNAILGRITASE